MTFVSGSALRYQNEPVGHPFCNQKQLENIVKLAKSIQFLHEEEFQVISVGGRRRRHHDVDISQNVMTFYSTMSHRLTQISKEIMYLEGVMYFENRT